MLKRFLGFLLAAALLVGFGYLFYLNPSSVEFRLSAERAYALPLPLLLLLAFLAGAAAIFLLALLRETQWTIAEARRRRHERKLEQQRSALATGRRLHWEGLPDQARNLVWRLREAPDTVEASVLLAESALASDRVEEARGVLDAALARHPNQPQLLALLATTERRLGRPGLATAHLEKAVALEPRSPRLLSTLRDSYIDEGRWSDALATEERLLATLRLPEEILGEQPRTRSLRYQAALAADGDGRIVEQLGAVLAQYPGFLPAAVALGDSLCRLGRPREAARVWVRAAYRRPLPVVLSRIEAVYERLGHPKRVLALYHSLRKRENSPALLLRQARFLLAQGRIDEAVRELDAAPAELERVAGFHGLWA
ncbi:MAG: tetratricopeptide repeat protein, partial [Candidatus Binatia bacterium]